MRAGYQEKVAANPSHTSNSIPSSHKKRPPRRRRIYTDDSDIFVCALHAGWISWSSAKKAREEGKDLKVRLRIIRCL
ncbi:uncharacterized protein C8R40DRAFT_1048413, partial [Lentinula edodes]